MSFLFHKYPQNLWAREITRILNSGHIKLDNDTAFVDAPCGNGIIAHFVSKSIKDKKIIALDNNPGLKNSAYINSGNKNLEAHVDDIFSFKLEGDNHVWLLINSLYCLPFKEKLISGKKEQYKYIIAVFPDIKASNFTYFTEKHPEFENPSVMTLDETSLFFEKEGYSVMSRKKLTHVKFHALGELFEKLRVHHKVKNFILTLLDYLLFFRKGQYEIMVFARNEKNTADL